jgi:hypothetical protein
MCHRWLSPDSGMRWLATLASPLPFKAATASRRLLLPSRRPFGVVAAGNLVNICSLTEMNVTPPYRTIESDKAKHKRARSRRPVALWVPRTLSPI